MTRSADKLAAQLNAKSARGVTTVRGLVPGQMPTTAQRIAFDLLGDELDEPLPGTRNVLPCDPFEQPFERPGAEQAQYRRSAVPSSQLRRPVIPQATRARGANTWGSAPGQLGGVRPEPRPAT